MLYLSIMFRFTYKCTKSAKNGTTDNNKKAWEIGIGATGLQMTRFNVINFHTNNKGGYTVGTNKKISFSEEIYILLVNLTLILSRFTRNIRLQFRSCP